MKNMRSLVLSLLLINLPLSGNCSSLITAQVMDFGVYGNGNVWLTLDKATDQPGCSTPYLEFAATSPVAKVILAEASLAVASGLKVIVQVDGCNATGPYGNGTFTGARSGAAFGVKKP